MKTLISWALLVLAACLSGCASSEHELVLAPVGPPPSSAPAVTGAPGSLVVFSALEPAPSFNSITYRKQYTDYRVFSADGKNLVQAVHNDTGKLLEGPRTVELPEGNYRVIARANGYGTVTVPVTIKPNRLTMVHLEGGTWWPSRSTIFESEPVRLPDGQIVGWRADAGKAD
jgi:hypothetical protein